MNGNGSGSDDGEAREEEAAGPPLENAWLVENGYAQVMTIPPNVKHQDLFLKLQREAGRGLWAK
ncbi:MAG: hypothetical protein L0214_01935 [candidate division NC10 bacterium]|nr:hypothetical protein [candidate division NC10 bacterium]